MTSAENDRTNGEPQADGVNTEDEKAAGGDQVQAIVDETTAKGYFGDEADPTPNENYTFAGQAKGLPTPETDKDAAAEAGSTKFR